MGFILYSWDFLRLLDTTFRNGCENLLDSLSACRSNFSLLCLTHRIILYKKTIFLITFPSKTTVENDGNLNQPSTTQFTLLLIIRTMIKLLTDHRQKSGFKCGLAIFIAVYIREVNTYECPRTIQFICTTLSIYYLVAVSFVIMLSYG